MILVTGGTGHLGNVLVRELIAEGESVRVLVYPGEDTKALDELDVELVYGDVRDPEAVEKAVTGVDSVFHMAGIVAIVSDHPELLEAVNVQGTRNIVNACIAAGVRRLVYTSSIHALQDIPHGTVIDEKVPFDPVNAVGAYGKSKAKASLAVLEGVARGLDAVICCPTGVYGPYDFRPSRTGRLLLNAYIKGRQSLPEGSYDFVDVRDIARGEILAWRHGKKGETYILAGEKLSLGNMVKLVQKLVGRKIAVFRIPMWMCRLASKFIYIGYRITGKEPLVTAESLSIVRSNCVITSKKAEREIGFTHRPPADTVRDTIAWFTRAGKLLPETGGGRKRRGV